MRVKKTLSYVPTDSNKYSDKKNNDKENKKELKLLINHGIEIAKEITNAKQKCGPNKPTKKIKERIIFNWYTTHTGGYKRRERKAKPHRNF